MRLVILDVDGTLVDSQALILAAQRAAFAAVGLPAPTPERSLSIVGLSLHEAFTALVGTDGPVEALAGAYRDAFAALRADSGNVEPLFPGMGDLVVRLATEPGTILGIATGKSRRGVAHLLARHGWEKLFATIQTADDAPSKPHPGMILQAMAETGARPDETVMVGDTTFDMLMARGANVASIGVSWGYHPVAALREAGAGSVVDDAAALEAALAVAAPEPVHA